MKIVLMGCGRIGSNIATTLWRHGHQVTTMDTEAESFLLLPQEMVEQEDTTLVGDGTLEADLRQAGLENADVFVAVAVRRPGISSTFPASSAALETPPARRCTATLAWRPSAPPSPPPPPSFAPWSSDLNTTHRTAKTGDPPVNGLTGCSRVPQCRRQGNPNLHPPSPVPKPPPYANAA